MNIALIQLPHFYGDGLSRPPECYPLGLGYISNALSANGIEHKGIDLWGPQYTVDQALYRFNFSNYDYLGISVYSTQYKYFKEFTLKIKKKYPKIPIICGGPGPTFSHEIFLKNTGADICVIGEGEITIIDLLTNFNEYESVQGIAYLKDGRVQKNQPRRAIPDLAVLKFPNRELFDFKKIALTAGQQRDKRNKITDKNQEWISADIISGRGCPYKCSYCSRTFKGLRLRSIENLTAEIVELKEKFKVNHLLFNDELTLINKKRSLQLCTELKNLDIAWSCQGRINCVDKEILTAMKSAGCIEIGYGVESISQPILDNMNKGIKAESILPAIRMTQQVGIVPIIQYMYGYPGENDRTIEATIKFFNEIDHPFVGFTTTPLPGTRLYHDCLDKGLIADEEAYLARLDSGYNLDGGMINLTDFSDRELLKKKRRLLMIISHNYYKKRPFEYFQFISGIIKRKILGLMRNKKRTGLIEQRNS